jgi:hypothetical protein
VTLTVTPSGGFHSTIAFSCTGGLPSGTVCVFSPSSVVPGASASPTTVLTISPSGAPLQTARSVSVPGSPHALSPRIAMTFAGLLFFFVPRRARRWSVLTMLLALSTVGLLSGCGSGGVDPNFPSPGALSAGSYAVTVTATGGSTIQTATVNLTIQ